MGQPDCLVRTPVFSIGFNNTLAKAGERLLRSNFEIQNSSETFMLSNVTLPKLRTHIFDRKAMM
jgi:hypothetical protein